MIAINLIRIGFIYFGRLSVIFAGLESLKLRPAKTDTPKSNAPDIIAVYRFRSHPARSECSNRHSPNRHNDNYSSKL